MICRLTAVLALAAAFVPWMLVGRLARNAFTPAIPRPVDPLYPLVDEVALARDLALGARDLGVLARARGEVEATRLRHTRERAGGHESGRQPRPHESEPEAIRAACSRRHQRD